MMILVVKFVPDNPLGNPLIKNISDRSNKYNNDKHHQSVLHSPHLQTQDITMPVQFSTDPTFHTSHYTLKEGDAEPDIWHSTQDSTRFQRELILDSRACIGMLSRKASLRGTDAEEGFSQEELAQCVGLEAMLSPNMRNQILATRKRHVQVILRQQMLQRIVDGQNEQILANLSWASSQWSRERAITIAHRYRAGSDE